MIKTARHALEPQPILRIGDPRLRQVCEPVTDLRAIEVTTAIQQLHATLSDFRIHQGFGRAMAAPQIGVPLRIIALNLGQGPVTMINPEITWQSEATFRLWDDCLSIPAMLIRVCRRESISVRFLSDSGAIRHWERLDRATSELLQHEIDHLHGILAIDRAIDAESLIDRELFQKDPDRFRAQVDYLIGD